MTIRGGSCCGAVGISRHFFWGIETNRDPTDLQNAVKMGQIMIYPNFMDENQDSPVDRLQFSMVFLEVWMAVGEALWCGVPQVILLAATWQLTMLT